MLVLDNGVYNMSEKEMIRMLESDKRLLYRNILKLRKDKKELLKKNKDLEEKVKYLEQCLSYKQQSFDFK